MDLKKEDVKKNIKASDKFITVLAVVSILGFVGIVSVTLFGRDIGFYIEALWMVVIGLGLVAEGQVGTLGRIRGEGLTPRNFTHLITVIIGVIAIVAGIFSFPQIRIEAQGFLAVKGIISVIAIIIIIVQTWIVE